MYLNTYYVYYAYVYRRREEERKRETEYVLFRGRKGRKRVKFTSDGFFAITIFN